MRTHGQGAKPANFARMAQALLHGIAGKRAAFAESLRLARPRAPLRIRKEAVAAVQAELLRQQRRVSRTAWSPHDETALDIVRHIREETERHNRNNVTRTAAYLALFRAYPELHWALLAHLVSRNGGWSMTDLQGEWLPKLMDDSTRSTVFRMLESCNALIFRDAYPQLRLYAETRQSGRSLFGLLPAFGVSAFMAPFWERFRIDGDSAVLTVALIVNEQHVIEHRVIRDPSYRDDAEVAKMLIRQRLLQLNQVVFPLGVPASGELGAWPRLAGRIIERFDDITERIEFGKSLYAMLYAYPKVLQGAVAFTEAVPHSGSRADYGPGLFTAASAHSKTGGRSEDSDRAAGGYAREQWFSPRLEDAWADQPLGPVSDGDWLGHCGLAALRHMRGLRPPRVFYMTREHEFGQRKLQAAVLAKHELPQLR